MDQPMLIGAQAGADEHKPLFQRLRPLARGERGQQRIADRCPLAQEGVDLRRIVLDLIEQDRHEVDHRARAGVASTIAAMST